jgi:hypothetical protein
MMKDDFSHTVLRFDYRSSASCLPKPKGQRSRLHAIEVSVFDVKKNREETIVVSDESVVSQWILHLERREFTFWSKGGGCIAAGHG